MAVTIAPAQSYAPLTVTNNGSGQTYNPQISNAAPAVLGTSTGRAPVAQTPAFVPNQANVALLNQSIANLNAGIGRSDTQLANGLTGIDQATQLSLSKLLDSKNQATTEYNTGVHDTTQNYITGKNTINRQSGQALNGLLRLLGAKGNGGSSVYNTIAPQAVGGEANDRRNALSQDYGSNRRLLDLSNAKYNSQYDNAVTETNAQRVTNQQALRDEINRNKADSYNKLGKFQSDLSAASTGLGAQNAVAGQGSYNTANSLLNAIAGVAPVATGYTPFNYSAPTLDSYSSNPFSTPHVQNTAETPSSYISPYLASLLKPQKQSNLSAV